MTFLEHLEELRVRVRAAAIAFAVCTLAAYFGAEWIFTLLVRPLAQAWTQAGMGQPELWFKSPTEPLFVYIKVALLGGFFLSSPYLFFQLWRFVAPGLYRKERAMVLRLVVGSALCFAAGALFGYLVVFPALFEFLLGYAQKTLGGMQHLLGGAVSLNLSDPVRIHPAIMMEEYLGLVAKTLIGFGVCFELPVLMMFFGLAGIADHRTFLRLGRYAIVVIVAVAGIVTPDPTMATQILLAIPLIALYYLGVLFVFLSGRRRTATESAGGVAKAG